MKKLRKIKKAVKYRRNERTAGGIVFLLGFALLVLIAARYFSGTTAVTNNDALFMLAGTIALGVLMCGAGVYCFFVKRGHVHIFAIFLVLLIVWFPLDFAASKLRKMNSFRQENQVYHHSLKPNSTGSAVSSEFSTYYEINSVGLRNPEIGNKTKIRMLVLGDSFTEGYGVNYSESMPARLQYYFGDDYEIINGGVASFSPTLEYLYLTTDGIKLNPDIVILNLDNSDLRDDYVTYAPRSTFDREGNLISVNAIRFRGFYYTSQIFDVLASLVTNKVFYLNYYGLNNANKVGNPKYDAWFHTRLKNCDDFEAPWNASFKYIKDMKSFSDKNNIKFYVVLYPYGHQVAANQWTEGRKVQFFDSNKIYPLSLADCFDKHGDGIKVLSLLEDFKSRSSEKLYYDIDPHMTAHGYDVMAYGVYRQLKLDLHKSEVKIN